MDRPTKFRKTRFGYDRFEVDAKFEEMEASLSILTRKIGLYQIV